MGTWEQCVREVTLSADPDLVGEVGVGWNNLSTTLGYLRDALVGRSFVGPIAPGAVRPHTDGLPGLLAGWTGSGGDAYREHLSDIGRSIEDLITTASNVGGALSRIEGDIRKAVASIPIPLMDDFGVNEWSLPNGGELDDANDGGNASGFLAALRADYRTDPSSYADGAFREKADDLEATMKVDGRAGDQKRGGLWDTSSHLNNWYRDNQQVANSAMVPLPQALETERPRLEVPEFDERGNSDGFRPRTPPAGYTPAGLDGGVGAGGAPTVGGGSGYDGGGASPGVAGISGGASSGGSHSSVSVPSAGGSSGSDLTGGSTGSYPAPLPRSGDPIADLGLGTSLAGAGGPIALGGGPGGSTIPGLGGHSPLGIGAGPGLGSPSGIGGAGFGAGGGLGVGGGGPVVGGQISPVGIPGMVGGGNGRVPPMTSAASALRNAAGGGRAGAGAGGSRGSAGGMIGGVGRESGAEDDGAGPESLWLTEDGDPWGRDDTGSPGILR
ncbi:hypothetical protein ACFWDZ_09815 [Micromonospora aurantiaca]|uniref:hypothetical protein n=1 Tax=Micromonospora aurantiaca (nom. illeg.) TaxID=47850 RepID=UPI0036681A9C